MVAEVILSTKICLNKRASLATGLINHWHVIHSSVSRTHHAVIDDVPGLEVALSVLVIHDAFLESPRNPLTERLVGYRHGFGVWVENVEVPTSFVEFSASMEA